MSETDGLDEFLYLIDDYDKAVLERRPNAIAIHGDLYAVANRCEDQMNLIDNLVDELFVVIDEDWQREYHKRKGEVSRAALVEFYEGLNERSVDMEREKIRDLEDQLNEAVARVERQRTFLKQAQFDIDTILNRVNIDVDERDAKFTEMIQHPRIKEVTLTAHHIVILTDDIILRWPERGEERWLGPFTIKIPLNPNTSVWGFVNHTTYRAGRDHPHIPDNNPCFGNVAGTFSSLLDRGDFPTLLELCFQYLETFNPEDDYGRTASLWFERPDAREELYVQAEVA
jgi:hypothetical protein